MNSAAMPKVLIYKSGKNIEWKIIAALLITLFCTNLYPVTDAMAGKILIPDNAYLPTIKINKLEAEIHPESNIIRVWGNFTNTSLTTMKGFLSIYLLDGQGNLIYSVDIPANNGKAFTQGQTVSFDEVLSVSHILDAAMVRVDFTRE